MTSARAGRRRRLLQDNASTTPAVGADQTAADSSGSQRYAFRQGSVSLAVARDLVPRSWGAIATTMVGMGVVGAGLIAADSYGLAAAAAGTPGGRLLLLDGVGSIAGWVTSVVWMSIAALAAVVFGLRRQRMDDVRSTYRWWLVGGVAALALSFTAATHAHQIAGGLLADATGFSPLPGNAFWWLALGTPVFGIIALRLVLDASSSRLGVIAGAFGMAVIGAGWLVEARVAGESLAGLMPTTFSLATVGPACVLAGPMVLLLSLLLVNRQIVAEAEGKVAAPRRKASDEVKQAKAQVTSAAAEQAKPATARMAESKPTKRAAAEREKAKPTVWTNGADDYADEYDDDQPKRRLSKAERKRLRRQKARNAA